MRASANDLNPNISSDLRYMHVSFGGNSCGSDTRRIHGKDL